MTLIEGMRSFLLANADISSMVGGSRIYPLRLPQKATFPAIVLTRVSEVNDAHLRGPFVLTRARIQLDAWALTFDLASKLGTLCDQRLDGYQGSWVGSGSPPDTLQVQAIFHNMAADYFEEDILGGMCRQGTDYFVTSVVVGEPILI